MAYSRTLAVTIGDINYGQHMGNDRFLTFFHEARLGFLETLGASEASIEGATGLIMTEATVKYLAQVARGDELAIRVTVEDIAKASFTLAYEAVRKSDGRTVASGRTALCAFDYAKNRIARLPEAFITALAAAQASG